MAKRIFITFLFGIFIFPLASLELEAEFSIGTMAFADARPSSETTLPLIWPWGISISAHETINEEIALHIGVTDDTTLRWIGQTLIEYHLPVFTLSVGPFFGILNSATSILKPGITTAVLADIPQIAFFHFRADSTIGGRLIQAGDYLQERSDISIGFHAKNAIASLNLLTKSFVYRSDTQEIVDSYLEYSFRADLYQKNVPFRAIIDFAFQERGKSYIDISTRDSIEHRLRSIVIGTQLDVKLSSWLAMEIAVDSSIFSFGAVGSEPLSLPTAGIEQYLFNASLGFRVTIE
jgi:hypothetical protein